MFEEERERVCVGIKGKKRQKDREGAVSLLFIML